jgi:riboflavin transporter FmnP
VILPSVDSIEASLLIFNVPFTFVKGMIDVLITLLIYKPLSPILKGKR